MLAVGWTEAVLVVVWTVVVLGRIETAVVALLELHAVDAALGRLLEELDRLFQGSLMVVADLRDDEAIAVVVNLAPGQAQHSLARRGHRRGAAVRTVHSHYLPVAHCAFPRGAVPAARASMPALRAMLSVLLNADMSPAAGSAKPPAPRETKIPADTATARPAAATAAPARPETIHATATPQSSSCAAATIAAVARTEPTSPRMRCVPWSRPPVRNGVPRRGRAPRVTAASMMGAPRSRPPTMRPVGADSSGSAAIA